MALFLSFFFVFTAWLSATPSSTGYRALFRAGVATFVCHAGIERQNEREKESEIKGRRTVLELFSQENAAFPAISLRGTSGVAAGPFCFKYRFFFHNQLIFVVKNIDFWIVVLYHKKTMWA
jgi:hypothetical protein